MDLDLGLASSFLVLAEERHFGHAAARLHLTTSALSKRIRRLERQLGVTVVRRGPSGVTEVTPAGLRFAQAVGPLLAQAAAARAAAQHGSESHLLRIGVPAGAGYFLSRLGFTAIVRDVRRHFPEVHLVWRGVPFSELDDCVAEGAVDVLWTTSPVRHAQVESVPLQVTSDLIGIVAAEHPLAGAEALAVEEFSEQPMLYNPAVVPEWMEPFWLADVRPRREARLVPCAARDQVTVLREVARGSAVTTNLGMTRDLLGPQLCAIPLQGASPVHFHAASRRHDHREAVGATVAALQAVAPGTFD
jgi:DNA-binding transcriptional LysR family regulator